MYSMELQREEVLHIWMRRQGLTYAKLGELMGLSRMSVLRLCKAKRISSARGEQFRSLGIPADLLPEIRDIPLGRPRKR